MVLRSTGNQVTHTMGENTNVVSSPPEIKVSPSLVQLKAFTHLVSKILETEAR